MGFARRAWHRSLTALFGTGLLLAAIGAAKADVAFFGLTFPDRVADAQLESTTDFEKTRPGLGYGVRYRQPGWTIDVYVYDLGRSSIPDAVESNVVRGQLQQAQRDIFDAYAKVELQRSYVMRDGGGHPRLQCADFAYVHEKTGPVDSVLCLTSRDRKFLKFRMTSERHADSQAEAMLFLNAWIGILWP